MKRVAGNAKSAKNIEIEKASPARKSRELDTARVARENWCYLLLRMTGSWVAR